MADTASSSTLPFVSVIVPALNCAEDVQSFAEAMRQQDYPADRFEIIVVDNGSSDDTFERARTAGMIALKREEKGRARALNTGIKTARGELILTTDLSCRAEPYWIRAVVETFADHPEAGCVAGEIKLLRATDGAVIDFQERSNYMSPLLALNRTRLPFMPFADGANASFRKRVFDEIGGFEESFVKAADVEICYRMFVLTDYTLVFNRSALMWEPGEPSLRALLHQRFRMGIGWNLMRMKYPALYKANKRPFNPRQMWWKVRGSAIKAIHLITLNLGLLFGRNREATIDANIRQLMSWAQWLGGHYGRWWLDSRGIHPEPVELEKLRQLMSKKDPLHGRVGLVEMPASKQS
ncbi:MAG: glycosyltransferase [Gammaproteobacteria bacterium]|nr:glycosyltransferase [Gammaproteobacteria bacterium]